MLARLQVSWNHYIFSSRLPLRWLNLKFVFDRCVLVVAGNCVKFSHRSTIRSFIIVNTGSSFCFVSFQWWFYAWLSRSCQIVPANCTRYIQRETIVKILFEPSCIIDTRYFNTVVINLNNKELLKYRTILLPLFKYTKSKTKESWMILIRDKLTCDRKFQYWETLAKWYGN